MNGFFLIVENASLATTYPDVPVTVATAERSFSKLKLIKNFLRSSRSQERLNGLAYLKFSIVKIHKSTFVLMSVYCTLILFGLNKYPHCIVLYLCTNTQVYKKTIAT